MDKLDLNNLMPGKVEVVIGEDTLYMQPPTLRSLFFVSKMAAEYSSLDTTGDRAEEISKELKIEMDKLCPGLDKHELNGNQLIALVDLVVDISKPKEEGKEADNAASPKVKKT